MYTGIVDHTGQVSSIKQGNKNILVTIGSEFSDLIEGESINVDGFCITVISPKKNGEFSADISPETYELTTAKYFKKNSLVNLERSMQLNDRFGGHFVMGHVDKTCVCSARKEFEDFIEMTFSGLTKEDKPYFAKKGSIGVNGVSLTINEVFDDSFQVMLIPHTLERTNLKLLNVGDKVNIEFDTLARIVVNQLRNT